MKKLWHALVSLFCRPAAKIGLGILVTVGFIAGVLSWQGFTSVMGVTNSEEFCVGCHTMQANLHELKDTVHWSNRSGVRAKCADCHVPHDFTDKMARKMKASVEVWSHITGEISTPEKFEENRLRLAQNEWARFRANGSKECRSCHDYKSMDFEKMRETSREAMRGAAQRNQSCLDCHKGIAHHKPATGNSRNPAFDGLMQAASSVSAKEGAIYYNVFPRTLYLDEALSQTAGKLEIAAAVKVLQEKGDAQQVEISAWRKSKGYGRVWYGHFGKNITQATLEKNVAQDAQRIKVTESREDPNTGLIWQKTSGVFWIKKGEVVEKIDPLWSVARDSYKSSCSVCHKQPDEAHFDANTWPGLFGGMVGFTSMDKDTQALVLKYLQSNSSDFKQAGH